MTQVEIPRNLDPASGKPAATASPRQRLAVVVSHPIQYYSPWFRHLAEHSSLDIKVFYLWDFGVKETRDLTFNTSFTWDIPLLDGYSHGFIPNCSKDPGTHHFRGLNNPNAEEAILEWQPDVLLLFGYTYATHLRLILSPRLRQVRFIFRGDSHDLVAAHGWKPALSRFLRRVIFRRFDCFLATGKANRDYFLHSGASADRIRIAPHCVDNDRFQSSSSQAHRAAAEWKQELGIPAEAPVVLFAGKFEEKKRPLDLLHAFLGMKKTAASAPVLLFVGSGSLEAALREAAGEQVGKTIFFAPFQNQSQMPRTYASGDLLVLPSHGRGETWGLALNEAMNLGKPVIASSHVGSGPDLVIEGKTGWTFPAGDVDALRDRLEQALSNREPLQAMGESARKHIDAFSYEHATRALTAAVAEITATA